MHNCSKIVTRSQEQIIATDRKQKTHRLAKISCGG
jgi:hypothetical protein